MFFAEYAKLLLEETESENRIVYWFNPVSSAKDRCTVDMIKKRFRTAKICGHVCDLRRPYAPKEDKWTYAQYLAHEKAITTIFRLDYLPFDTEFDALLKKYDIPYDEIEGVYNVPHKPEKFEIKYEELVKRVFPIPPGSFAIREDMAEHAIPLGIQANDRIRCLYRYSNTGDIFRIVLSDPQKANVIVSAFVDPGLSEFAEQHRKKQFSKKNKYKYEHVV